MTHRRALLLAFIVFALAPLPARVHAQASIEVVASLLRDEIDTPNHRQQVGIADDGTIVFTANTPSGGDRLLSSTAGSASLELGISARVGSDVAINDNSVLYISGAQVQAIGRDPKHATPFVVQDCSVASTPCGGVRHLSLASDGYFAITAYDSSGGIYRGRLDRGRLSVPLVSVPVLPALITALGMDVRTTGRMLMLGDFSFMSAETYGAFGITWNRVSYTLTTAVSTRPRARTELPQAAVFGGTETFALMPAQTDASGAQVTLPAIVRGEARPYPTAEVRGTPLLTLQSVDFGSMDANTLGLAAVVATLPGGWAGLFTFDTAHPSTPAVQLVALERRIGKCPNTPLALHVLGTNDAGQIAVLASVQTSKGVDTQVWRVTPTASPTTTSYCTGSFFKL